MVKAMEVHQFAISTKHCQKMFRSKTGLKIDYRQSSHQLFPNGILRITSQTKLFVGA